MPIRVPKRNVTDAENKLRVLCCVNALGMVTLEQLWPFVAKLELMEYMPLCLFVDELKKDGALDEGAHANKGALYLSQQGMQMLTLFETRLLPRDKERIEKAAPAYAARMSEREQVHAVHERAAGGMYQALCTVAEGDAPTLVIRVASKKRAFAAAAVKRFSQCASRLLTLLYTLPQEALPIELAKAASPEDALAAAAAQTPAVYTYGKHDHSATVCVHAPDASFTIALLLPSEEAAALWAAAATSDKAALGNRIAEELLGTAWAKKRRTPVR